MVRWIFAFAAAWYGSLTEATRPRASYATSTVRWLAPSNDTVWVRIVRPSASRWRVVSGAMGERTRTVMAGATAPTFGHGPQRVYEVVDPESGGRFRSLLTGHFTPRLRAH